MWTYTLKNVLALILSAAVFIASANVSVYAENADRKTAYLLMELSTGTVLSDNNKDTVVSVGTMAKLMTVLLVAEKINSGREAALRALSQAGYTSVWRLGRDGWVDEPIVR